jgi:hypothetical protein
VRPGWLARLLAPGPHWLTRFAVLRGLGFVYLVAFVSLANQILPLEGSRGLTPVPLYLARVAAAAGGRFAGLLALPSLFWIDASDAALVATCWLGALLSLLVLAGLANALLLGVLWLLYLSLVHVGQIWFSFGWEIQLLETGLIAVFLCPLLDARPFPRTPPPRLAVWLLRWLVVRLMLGAGLIKLRGDPCWRDLTCLFYHFETQPIPSPGSWLFHNLPHAALRLGVAFNHLAELAAPFALLGGRRLRHAGAAVMALFQLTLIASGNLSFLNWLTLVAILGCFDDAFLGRLLPRRLVAAAERARAAAHTSRGQQASVLAFALLVALLSIAPVGNLLSSRQIMNTSFDRLHIVNTYGAFGSVGRERDEIVLEGTSDSAPTDTSAWKEYEWKCKPGDPMRRPCLVTPYHYRLDWLVWFAAMSDPDQHPWLVHLVWKLLHGDAGALSLLAVNPFPDAPPRFIRAELYRYEFTRLRDPSGAWWIRRRVGEWLPPLSADSPQLLEFLRAHGWLRDARPGLSAYPTSGGS